MNATPSRHQRRALERRADRVVKRTFGLEIPPDTVLAESVVLLGEHQRPQVVSKAAARHAIGGHLGEVLEDLEAMPLPAAHLPALVLIDGWVQALFLSVHVLSAGGEA